MSAERVFVDWEGRPAVIEGSRAWAVLRTSDDGWRDTWTEVDSAEVADSGYVRTESFLASTFRTALRGVGGFSTIPRMDGSAPAKGGE